MSEALRAFQPPSLMDAMGDEERLCWRNRWSKSKPRCKKLGAWGNPDAADSLGRAMRWCDEHRHPNDKPVVDDAPPQETP